MTEVKKLEEQLKQAKIKEYENLWCSTTKEIIDFINKIKHCDFFTSSFGNFPRDCINLTRIINVKDDNYYGDIQGWYGQFSKKRFIELECQTLTIGSQYLSGDFMNTDDAHSNAKVNSPITFLNEGKGFPIGPKKSWSKEYTRIIQTGDFNIHTNSIKFGDKLINEFDGVTELKQNFYKFKNNIGLTTDKSIFDSLTKLYIKQCKESMELMEVIKQKEKSFYEPDEFLKQL